MNVFNRLHQWWYSYTPRFMTEHYFCIEKGNCHPWTENFKPGENDFVLRLKFFNFFGRPLLMKSDRFPLKQQ